jgi:hypothetical protein
VLRRSLFAFVAAQFLMPGTAGARGGQTSYARFLTFEEARQVLHCPWCSYPASQGLTYFVRTAEDLNVGFGDLGVARNADVLLNVMANAQSHCDRTGYDLAFDEYAIVIGTGKQDATQERAEMGGVFGLLYPRRDLTSLAEYVVPLFHACGGNASLLEE